MKKSKRFIEAQEALKSQKMYDIAEAMALVVKHATAKFDESIEAHLRLNIDPTKGDQAVRGTVTLPHGTGKDIKIAAIVADPEEAKKAGADVVGGEELITQIKAGKLPEVDVIITTPDMMPKLASAAKVLGPRGLMPSPKTDTVTTDVTETIAELKKGKDSFKNDKGGCIHQVIGKASFGAEKLTENLTAFVDVVNAQKSDAHKGKLIASLSVCSTMGPSVKVHV